jgi:glycine betaine/proline transport system substrate-binding protein
VRANLDGGEVHAGHQRGRRGLGIADFGDIAGAADALDAQIYGIEPGNDGNRLIMDMIAANAFGLGDAEFEVVESSEQGMLAQVARASDRDEPIVFLGWEPHPMNANFDLTYLTGGDDWFGPTWAARPSTPTPAPGSPRNARTSGRFLNNLEFSLAMENEIMGAILNDGEDPEDAATAWLTANPDVVMGWLDGVTTVDGGDAAAAVSEALGL